ncbi:MAG: His/Gly/Thr/Pro-type tRNA ligase C-terminal domain-containing protein [Alphaproteobacteria bacterium]|nr:His/Gly/Thr/Pro-type tRNA ligase C-terminal domain-containing protein [Alphaproteobacteria bacterium]
MRVEYYGEKLKKQLSEQTYAGQKIRVKLDARDIAGGDKKWEWVKKGAPIILEIGMRDIEANTVCMTRRDRFDFGKQSIEDAIFVWEAPRVLADIQKTLFEEARALRQSRLVTDIKTWAGFEAYFSNDADNTFASGQGFILAKWSGDTDALSKLDPLGVTVRCVPFEQSGTTGCCVLTGKPATQDVIFARAY